MILEISTHKNILLQILKDIFTNSAIGPILGFKGGTAAYLFYDLNRFSVDLDFDLLDLAKEKYIFEGIKTILERYGNLKEAEKVGWNLFFELSYKDKEHNSPNIKVEINLRDFGSRYDIKSYLGISMKVMVKEDMFAHKLVAMLEREEKERTNRDVFDAWFFLKNNWSINKELVEKRTGISFKDYLKKCIDVLEKMNNSNILAGTGELLDEKQKAWAKKNLISDTLFLLKLRLNQETLENN